MTGVDRLYAVPLEAFAEERKRLAKELRAAGDKEAAAEVAKWPKPTPPAWALNHLARERPETVAEWLRAAEALRDASTRAAAVGGEALRSAMAEHREATARLLATVRDETRPGGKPLSPAMLDRVKALLQAATVDAERAQTLQAGRLLEDAAAPRMPAAAPAAEPEPDPEAQRRAELERQAREAEGEAQRLRTLAGERERAAGVAAERLQDAERTLLRSRTEAEAADAALEEAREQLQRAEREAQQLQQLLARRQ